MMPEMGSKLRNRDKKRKTRTLAQSMSCHVMLIRRSRLKSISGGLKLICTKSFVVSDLISIRPLERSWVLFQSWSAISRLYAQCLFLPVSIYFYPPENLLQQIYTDLMLKGSIDLDLSKLTNSGLTGLAQPAYEIHGSQALSENS